MSFPIVDVIHHPSIIINMLNLQELIGVIANCNLHFSLYGAFGTMFMMRAALCGSDHAPGEAREHFVHGMVYFILGLLR
jgi:hypothetical protein